MNNILKIKQTDTKKVWISSDFHLNHNPKWPIPIWKKRGFNSVEEMNNSIIQSINDNVNSTDILLFLGDFCLNTTESTFDGFLSRINCQNIYMLFGNHNSCVWSTYVREVKSWLLNNDNGNITENGGTIYETDIIPEIYPFRYRNIVFCGNYLEVSVDGKLFVLSHFPIHSWNNMKQGVIHLYGHQHCENNPKEGRRLDVGWDRYKRPYSVMELFNNLNKLPILSDGGHH